jgi:hypothetical protein
MFAHMAMEAAKSTPQVLNDLQRARLSCGCMIRLHTHPIHPPLPRQHLVSLSQSSRVSPVELTEGRGGKGRAWSRIIRPQESLVLYKSFSTLWTLSLLFLCALPTQREMARAKTTKPLIVTEVPSPLKAVVLYPLHIYISVCIYS